MFLLDQQLLQVPVTETTAVTFCDLTHKPQHPSPALQVLPELWPGLNLTFSENPFSGKSLALHVDFLQIKKTMFEHYQMGDLFTAVQFQDHFQDKWEETGFISFRGKCALRN